jgi:hypothetical protein
MQAELYAAGSLTHVDHWQTSDPTQLCGHGVLICDSYAKHHGTAKYH